MSMVNTHWSIGPSIVLVEKSLSLSLFVIKNAHHVSKSCRLSIQSRRNIELIDFWWRCYPGVLASIIATHHYLLVVLLLMYVKKYWFSFLSIQSMMLNNADSSCLVSLGDFWKKNDAVAVSSIIIFVCHFLLQHEWEGCIHWWSKHNYYSAAVTHRQLNVTQLLNENAKTRICWSIVAAAPTCVRFCMRSSSGPLPNCVNNS